MFAAKICSQYLNKQIFRRRKEIHSILFAFLKYDKTSVVHQCRNETNNAATAQYFGNLIKALKPADVKSSSVENGKNKPELKNPHSNTLSEDSNLSSGNESLKSLAQDSLIQNKELELSETHEDSKDSMAINNDDARDNNIQIQEDEFDTAIKSEKEEEFLRIDEVAPAFPVSFNLAPYVERSETLQEFVKLGVNLHSFEKDPEVAEHILRLDFKQDIKPYIQFLSDKGVPTDKLGRFFTRNPLIFNHSLENLQIRLNYLESKNFNDDAINRIITQMPIYLNLSTIQVDKRLGYLQKTFSLSGEEVRNTITRQPKLIVWTFGKLKQTNLIMKEELGFTHDEMKRMFLKRPKLWLAEVYAVKERFNLIHNTMGLSHEVISKQPEALLNRAFRTKQRHMYLQSLNRAQYDPSKENYVSLHALIEGTDSDFCEKIAKTPVHKYNEFLKTL